jgi:hypothetical protein
MIALDDLAQTIEVGGPHRAQERLERADGVVVRLVQAEVAGLTLGEQTGIAQDAQVLGHGGPADIGELGGDIAGGELAIPDEAQDGAATR